MIEQAGAIVVTANGRDRRLLLITSKRNPDHWIFPKGHVENGETLEEAALREAEEEAGIRGTIVERAGSLSFGVRSESLLVHYFVVATQDEGRPERGRQLEWLSYEEALDRLTFDDNRALLRKVWSRLKD
jgi:8-oxo-dGTP pyrophosphatase MutT (NUDIX family)